MNPKQADRLIEVYLDIRNPIYASDKLTKYFTEDSFLQMIREYNRSI